MIKFNHGQWLANRNPSRGERGGCRAGGRRALRNQGSHVAQPFGKKQLMQACCWEREETGSVLFCYLFKLSLIPHIVLELIWLNSLSPCERPLAIFWNVFFKSPQQGAEGGKGGGRGGERGENRGHKTRSIKRCCCQESETHILWFGAHRPLFLMAIQPASPGRHWVPPAL